MQSGTSAEAVAIEGTTIPPWSWVLLGRGCGQQGRFEPCLTHELRNEIEEVLSRTLSATGIEIEPQCF